MGITFIKLHPALSLLLDIFAFSISLEWGERDLSGDINILLIRINML